MRRIQMLVASAALALVLAAPATAQQTARGWAATSGVAVRVLNLKGTTRIIGWDRDSIAVSASVPPDGRLYGGGGRAAVKLGVEPAAPGGEPPAATLEVRVPQGASVSVKSATADVDVRGVGGTIEVMSVGGRIAVSGNPREVSVESMAGAIDVVGDVPVVRVRTAGGSATVDGAVEDLMVETVSGPIVVRSRAPRRTRLESTSGSIAFEGGLAADATLDVQTHESAVKLTLPRTVAASFELTTFDGLLINRFGSAAARPSRGGKPLRFTANGGGAQVTVRTLKGDVAVYRR